MTILIVGDSFTDQKHDFSLTIWPTLLGRKINNYPMVNHAQGGAGYVTPGIGPEPRRFSRQLFDRRDVNPALVKLVIIFGSTNDWYETRVNKQFYRSMVWETHVRALQLYPNAKLLVVGPQWAGPNPLPPEHHEMRNIILAEMWGYDWQYGYIDPIAGDPSTWWFPPNRLDLVSGDKFHPSQAGHQRIADLMEPHVRNRLGL